MKKMVKVILLFFSISAVSQSSMEYDGELLNRLDENGTKIGVWKLHEKFKDVSKLVVIDFDHEGKISYYKNSELVAVCTQKDNLEIYKDSKVIKAKYFYKPDQSQTLISEDGKELEPSLVKYFSEVSEIHPTYYPDTYALYDYIKIAIKKIKKSGKVKVKFFIDVNGFTKNIEVIESTNPEINEEVSSIIRDIPRWQPGFQGGKFVNVTFTIPINVN